MSKGLIIYDSKTGTTKKFSETINDYLKTKDAQAEIISVKEFKDDMVADKDFLLLGTWTHGLFIILQHPDKPWVEFAKNAPDMKNKKVALFTTYKVATGSVFKKMKKHLGNKIDDVLFTLKSKHGELTEEYKQQLDTLLN